MMLVRPLMHREQRTLLFCANLHVRQLSFFSVPAKKIVRYFFLSHYYKLCVVCNIIRIID